MLRRMPNMATRSDGDRYIDSDTWLTRATEGDGSWWLAWAAWLEAKSDAERVAPLGIGAPSRGLMPLCAYVHERRLSCWAPSSMLDLAQCPWMGWQVSLSGIGNDSQDIVHLCGDFRWKIARTNPPPTHRPGRPMFILLADEDIWGEEHRA